MNIFDFGRITSCEDYSLEYGLELGLVPTRNMIFSHCSGARYLDKLKKRHLHIIDFLIGLNSKGCSNKNITIWYAFKICNLNFF